MLIRMGMGTQMSGSVGGVVASRNKGGAYLRARSVPTNPSSNRQQFVRSVFGSNAQAWQALTAAQRTGWNDYAAATPVVNALGESIYLSGFNQFVRTNAFLAGASASTVADAPTTPGLCSLGSVTGVTISVATGLDFVTAGATADLVGLAQMGPVLSPGVKYFQGPFSLFGTDVITGTGFAGVTAGAGFPYAAIAAGQRRGVRIAACDTEGKLSNIFTQIVTVTA